MPFVRFWRNSGGDFSTIPQVFKENGYVSVGMGCVMRTRSYLAPRPLDVSFT